MPGTRTAPPRRPDRRRFLAVAALALLVSTGTIGRTAAAGPIAESFKRWSMNRQVQARIDKPFSRQSGQVDLTPRTSLSERLRKRMTIRPVKEPSGFQMSTKTMHHD